MTRREIIEILDGTHFRVGRTVAFGLYALIVVSTVALALETVPSLPPALRGLFLAIEVFTLAVFAVEYVLRLVCSPRPLGYAFSFWGIVDFLAVVPALLFLLPDMQSIRALRLLRLARLLKLLHMTAATDRIGNAFAKNRDELIIFTFIATVVLFLAAVGIYQFEHLAQPETFGSIPQSLWWAIATLTTVGYGDVYPVTLGGRVFTGFVLLVGIGIVAVPAGLITSALLEEKRAETPTKSNTEDN